MNYRYWTPYRPPMLGAIPTDGLIETYTFEERMPVKELRGREAWGYAVYDRELTKTELDRYEMAAAVCGIFAVRVYTDGTFVAVEKPAEQSMLDFWYENTGCDCVDIVQCGRPRGYYMVVDDEGRLKDGNPVNPLACWMYRTEQHGEPILGDVLVMKQEPEDSDDEDAGLMTKEEALAFMGNLKRVKPAAMFRFAEMQVPEPKMTVLSW